MAGYGGYFLQGLSSGLQTGFNMGQMKWQQNEKKKLKKKQDEMMESASVFNNMVAQLGEDGSYSDDDIMKINTSYMALGYDVKERVDGTYKAIQAMDKKTIETNYQYFDLVLEATQGMKSGDAQGIFDTIRPFVSGEKGLQMYEALENITKKKSEIIQPEDVWGQAKILPSEYRPGYLGTKGIELPTPVEAPKTELDIMGETGKKLDYAYATGNASYFNQMAKSLGVDTTFETYKKEYKEPEIGKAKVTPEGEITAGQKRKIDVEKDYRETAKEILYGEKDYMGMPTTIGIIPMDILMDISGGKELTNEQKKTILDNYNLRKETFNETVKNYVESILRQLGVFDIATPESTPEPKKTGIIQSIKDWFKGTPETPKEKTETDYWTNKYGF